MYVWLNLKTIQFYFIKLAANYYWQPSYLLGKRASLIKKATTETDKIINWENDGENFEELK